MRQNLVVQQQQAKHNTAMGSSTPERGMLDDRHAPHAVTWHVCRACAWYGIHSTSTQQLEKHRHAKELFATDPSCVSLLHKAVERTACSTCAELIGM
jgi:hypothetical protein